ncbi:MAG: polysaccharide deacetylase family protein [Caulobacteraceae bacterium]
MLGRNDDAVVVIVQPGETQAILAKRYLGDERKAWRVTSLEPDKAWRSGVAAVVAMRPIDPGGVLGPQAQRAPILCYHRFTVGKPDRMAVSAAAFEKQLQYLRDNGFTVVPLRDLNAFLAGQGELPPKAVVLTIDDGYRSAYEIAYPLLRRFNVPATIFVYSDFLGARDGLTPAQLKEMAQSGLVDIQSHTKTHADLRWRKPGRPSPDYLKRTQQELAAPREKLTPVAGSGLDALAYPYGAADTQVLELTAKSGYALGLTVLRGGNAGWTDPLLLHRDMVFGGDSLEQFAKRLAPARQGLAR